MDQLLSDVRLYIYAQMIETSSAPSAGETAAALDQPIDAVITAYRALAEQKALVLRRGSDTIWMAAPFSNAHTPFTVIAGGRAYYANCAWDALGIPAALNRDARIFTTCGDCGGAIERKVAAGRVVDPRGTVHFALPVRNWWDDVGFT